MEGATYEYANWVLFGLLVYMAGMLAVGWYASKRVQSQEDYTVAGRRLGLMFCTGTLVATWFGASTCMGVPGNAYMFGNQGCLFDPWASALCLVLVGFFFARLMRRGRYISTVDIFRTRFGRKMWFGSTIVLGLSEAGWVGALLVAFGTVISYFAGVPLEAAIIVSSLVLVIYTYFGGMWAVTLTDVFQVVILAIGMVVMFITVVPMAGGLDHIFTNDPSHNMMGINQWSFIPTPESAANPDYGNAGFFYYTGYLGWFYWAAAILSITFGVMPTQSLMQRFFSAKDEDTSVKSGYLGGLCHICLGGMPVLIGMIYFQLNPDLGVEEATNGIMLRMAVEYLHPVFAVLFICALVAAVMSSADSATLASATLFGYNGYKFFKPDATDEQTLKMTRLFVPIIMIFAVTVGMYFQAILNLVVATCMVVMVGLTVPFMATYYWKKANEMGALAALGGGFLAWIIGYMYYLPMTSEFNTGIIEEGKVYFEWAMWDAMYLSSIWGLIASAILMVVVSLATQKIDVPKPLVDVDGNPLSTKGSLGLFWKKKEPVLNADLAS